MHMVTGQVQNVIPLQRRDRGRKDLPVPIEHLCNAVQELQDFRDHVARTACDQRGSAQEWRVACTPLMLRLPVARQSLAGLTGIRIGAWPDTRWAVRLRTAHDEVDRRLTYVGASARYLVRKETCTADAVLNFTFESVKLAEALADLCDLIKARYPVTAITDNGQ